VSVWVDRREGVLHVVVGCRLTLRRKSKKRCLFEGEAVCVNVVQIVLGS
jgi:hypothetical protein